MRKLVPFLVISLLAALPLAAATAAEHAAAGRIALDRNDNQKAADLFTKAITVEPKNADFHFMLGVAYGELAQSSGMLKQASFGRRTGRSTHAARRCCAST